MSHFMCAVITDGTKTVEEMMAPYQENNMDTVPPEYLEFVDETETYHEEYESSTLRFSFDPSDEDSPILYPPWGKPLLIEGHQPKSLDDYETPEGWETTDIPLCVVFTAFASFMACMHPDVEAGEYGSYGYWENPNARWDWYTELSSPSWFDDVIGSAPVKLRDIDFDAVRHVEIAKREWERDHDDPYFRMFFSRGMSREQYVDAAAHLSFWACITPDGKWHDVAKMGWFGMADVSADEYHDWCVRFSRRFIDPFDGNCVMHVVNCHI